MFNQTELLDRTHPLELWRYREKYKRFQSQHNFHSQLDAQTACFEWPIHLIENIRKLR